MRGLNGMFLFAVLLLAPTMSWTQTSAGRNISSDEVSFYMVPLACPTVRNLGCGSAAKPVMLALQKMDTIREAWLDHPGTTLAIVWKKDLDSSRRTAELQSIANKHGISLHELRGAQREEDVKSFQSRQGWYRGAEVDRLSEEEAMAIVARLVRRAEAKAPTIAGKAEKLKVDIGQVVRERLTSCDSTECRASYRRKLEATARKDLTETEFAALMDAEKLGYRPVGDEQ